MRISVIGCGYLGAVHAAAMVSLGHTVIGVDVDEARVQSLAHGLVPFYEPGLPELLTEGLATGRLSFSTVMDDVKRARLHFLAIGTPQTESGAADLGFLFTAVAQLVPLLSPGDLVVGKSTVPVGVAARIAEVVESAGARLAWNPEFLREGRAVVDTLSPDRMVYGVREGDNEAVALLDRVYEQILESGTPRMVTDFATAELVKVAANAFLATKISFINAMAEVAEASGANIDQLADALGQDPRIGRKFLNSGLGFGGGCLPKDIRGFVSRGEELGVDLGFLREVESINLRRRQRVIDLAVDELGGSVVGKRITILGLAFKPNSDDVRDSPALDVARRLVELGAVVHATDPQALETARRSTPGLDYHADVPDALRGAELVLVLTEWEAFTGLDPELAASLVMNRTVIDGRNCLDSVAWQRAGWRVLALGHAVPAKLSPQAVR
ncbi:UDP-glucose/GDP-mannose dehydrogenase family protein [Glaciihabitans arcticus]|uniref:UDP-glucose 6-dehydrogenase n=1 Tax=Glaciihabitans arcticus TaxID=2668039 RepID=A0A4Q9GNR9_9MICO|nr:UDP-glucose/GDP-mannose dehydrogenase family protein [Glaciihabitans arcticus]TBN56442.1 UDP-glucose/GDP-mannose dehydrogenase family protein [Glaciihabitans arcticus]